MLVALPFLRVLLAGVFALAGIAKFRDLAGSRRMLGDFGVPSRLVPLAAVLLPTVEIVLAILLLPQATAIYGAAAAVLLLLLFLAVLTWTMARGRRPDCQCFGQFRPKPISDKVLVRNGALLAAAALVVGAGWPDGGASVVGWIVPLSSAERAIVFGGAIGLVLLMMQTGLLLRLVRQHDALLAHLQGAAASTAPPEATATPSRTPAPPAAPLPLGSPAPAVPLTSLGGEVVTLESLRAAGRPLLLIFSDPGCGPCQAMLPEVEHWQRDHAAVVTLALVSSGSADANRERLRDRPLPPIVLQQDREVADAFGLIGTPGAVLIDSDGSVGSLPVVGEAAVRRLVEQAVQRVTEDAAAAPEIGLPDLEGRVVALSQFRGRATLVLFWNPSCGFCRRMLADLQDWEARPLADRPDLLVISTGSTEDNRALGLRSTIVLDPASAVTRQYGVTGTPSGVLLDAKGRMASDVLVGARAILARVGQGDAREDERRTPITGPAAGAALALPPRARPIKQDCVQDELLPDGGMILYNGCRHEVLAINATGALVWECCDGDHDLAAIEAEIRDVFPAAPSVDRDVRELVDRLLHAGMISAASEPAEAARVASARVAVT